MPGPGSTAHYRNWNPPLLGNLPEDFLRILPQQTAGTQVRLGHPFQPALWGGMGTIPVLSHSELAASSHWVPGVD